MFLKTSFWIASLASSVLATPAYVQRDQDAASGDSIPGAPGQEYYTNSNGCPIMNPQASLRVGNQLRSTLLLQDINMIEALSHLTHERIPERIVHAKGAGAYGEFEVTHDITNFTSAAFLNTVGKKTRLFTRYSTVAGEKGSADSVRDGRGFAFKLYTEEGNLDWLFFNLPVFFIRDPVKLPDLVHAQKRNPQTNLKDASAFWDYMNSNAEGFNALMTLFSDAATPVSYRYTNIFGINTYKFTKQDGSFHYVKIHLKTNQGVANNTQAEAVKLSGEDPDSATRDLFDSIANGTFPSWTVYAQIIDPQAAQNYTTNIFDATKTISETDFPLIPFGKITLNENPVNFFAEVEQSAFSPTSIVPGWSFSPDPILQARLFAYGDTQRYRLGVNFNQLPVNRAGYYYNPSRRDGANNVMNYGAIPNYIPSSFAPTIIQAPQYLQLASHEEWAGTVTEFQSTVTAADFVQPRAAWEALGLVPGQQENFVSNVAASLSGAVSLVRERTYGVFGQIDADLEGLIRNATESLASTM